MLRCLLLFRPFLALASLTPLAASAEAVEKAPFVLPALPYSTNALVPAIDAKTMEIHHHRHHQAYVDNLNALIAQSTALQGMELTTILGQVSKYPPAVRNNAGGHFNHSFL